MAERTDTRDAASPISPVDVAALDVPEGFLRLPPACDWAHILRFESGIALDPHLCRLARLSGAIDRGLALRLLALRRSSGYLRLGKACFGDYVRERVGVAVRTAQEWVRLGRGLERLPLLDAALCDGRVTWTAAAQIARVAGVDEQSPWIRMAEQLSVRELKSRVNDALQERKAGGSETHATSQAGGSTAASESQPALPVAAAPDDSPGLFDLQPDDRPIKLRLLTSKRTAHLWESVLELCELVAGSPLCPAEAPEYILADFLSGAQPAGPGVRAFPKLPPRKHAYCGQATKGSRRVKYLSEPTDRLGNKQIEFTGTDLSPEVRRVLELVEADTPQDAVLLDASVQTLMAARRGLDLDLARMLRLFHWLGLARPLGFRSFTAYVEERLNISADRARFLLRLDRSLTGLDATRQAVRDGRIGTVAALAIARVCTPGPVESAWLRRAREVSVVRLRKEVRWAERENADGRSRATLPPSTGPLPSALQTLTVALLAGEKAHLHPFEGSRAWIRQEEEVADEPPEESATRETFAHRASQVQRNAGDGCVGHVGGETLSRAVRLYREFIASDEGPDGRFAVEFWLRESALELWTDARHRLAALSGRNWISDAQVLHEIALAFLLTHLRSWLQAVRSGDPTAVRDRFVCQVPGCTMRAGSGHHLRFRSDLGPDESWNLLFICWGHHLIGIHGGPWIRVTGRAPDALKAELGLLPEGKALETWVRGVPIGPDRACA